MRFLIGMLIGGGLTWAASLAIMDNLPSPSPRKISSNSGFSSAVVIVSSSATVCPRRIQSCSAEGQAA